MRDRPRRLRGACRFATFAFALVCLGAAARGETASSPEPLTFPESQLEPLAWAAVEGWQEDDHAASFAVFQSSCKPLIARMKWRRRHSKPDDTRPMRAALTELCVLAEKMESADGAAARTFFEENFRPVQVGQLGEETGLLTGYYEPIIEGSRFPSYEYTVPVYAPPPNLIALGRRGDGGAFPNKGRVGRRVGNKVVPYYERGEIEEGVLAGQGLEICWVKDPIDAFFMQIQGSARVKLDTGKTLRLNYAAHNGHPYTPVGRILIERDQVPKAEMSMDRIRQWMESNPDGGKDLRRENRSYVFMRETRLAEDVEPTGAQGISLTPGRSIAVDRKLHVYGTPFFINAELPIVSERAATPFRRLMVAQDTGSAIVGVARADIYFGAGDEAGRVAGRIKQQGKFVMLVPKSLDPAADAAKVPLPIARPAQPEDTILTAFAALAGIAAPKPAATEGGQALAFAAAPSAITVPLPKMRPQAPPQRTAAEAGQSGPPPAWLLTVTPIPPTSSEPVRSFAAAEAAILAAVSAPAAFAAPALTQAAASVDAGATWPRTVPAPWPRPHGIARADQ